jgi:hypothetical protein
MDLRSVVFDHPAEPAATAEPATGEAG